MTFLEARKKVEALDAAYGDLNLIESALRRQGVDLTTLDDPFRDLKKALLAEITEAERDVVEALADQAESYSEEVPS